MGCFVVPAATAIAAGCASESSGKIRRQLRSLALCEGAVAVFSAAEHVFHGEISTAWPYLTLNGRELATEGVVLALSGVVLWGMVGLFKRIRLRLQQKHL